jgi:sulfite reductase (NADPH) hemoprotein beta-component
MSDGEAKQLVTGNRLRDGVPIYFTAARSWSPVIDEALVVGAREAEALLAQAQEGPPPLPVIAPILIEAVVEDGHIRPLSLRERIRAFGPTI